MDALPRLLAVIAPPPGWPEVVVVGGSLILTVLVIPRFPSSASLLFRAVVTCGVATLAAVKFQHLVSGRIDIQRGPQLVAFGIAGSLAGILFVQFAGKNRSST